MSVNMSYCKFENTLAALQECEDSIFVKVETSQREENARRKLLELCHAIAEDDDEDYDDEDIDPTLGW